MSWDVLVLDLPSDAQKVTDIPTDYRPSPIKRSEIIERIIDVIPTADFSNPNWGLIIEQDWSIEVNLGKEQECSSIMLHVRGGDAAIGAVVAIVRRLNLRAIDCQTGDFFDAGDSSMESFRRWRAYRDRVIKSIKPT
jgi:hypothetical protein